jgi:capsular polysaccharide transport system permease protein
MTLLLGAATLLGFSDAPTDILAIMGAVGLMAWFAFGLGLLVQVLSHDFPIAGRLVHPLLYLAMPLSGAFFVLSWFPGEIRNLLAWIPLVHIFELLKLGQFPGYSPAALDIVYVVGWCATMTLVGLVALRRMRDRIELS